MSERPDLYLHFDDMTWPNPDDPLDIQWRCRYARHTITDSDFVAIASYLAAYRQLVEDPRDRRQQKITGLRAARDEARRG